MSVLANEHCAVPCFASLRRTMPKSPERVVVLGGCPGWCTTMLELTDEFGEAGSVDAWSGVSHAATS